MELFFSVLFEQLWEYMTGSVIKMAAKFKALSQYIRLNALYNN